MKGPRSAGVAGLAAVAAALVGTVVVASTSCSQTPTNVPVRTFQQPQRMDLVCIHVNDVNGNSLAGNALQPLTPDECPPLPLNWVGSQLENHLYAVVTQTTPGTLAVVDLINGGVVDEDEATPGINFIPVGPNPTDVAVGPDGAMTFVTSGDLIKPAIYGIDNRRLLGTSTGYPPPQPLVLTDLPACALPQVPSRVMAASRPGGGYVLLVMLRPSAGAPAAIVAVDPSPLLRGVGLAAVGSSDAGASDAGPVDHPGTLSACTILGATGLTGTLPPTFYAGLTWPDGVPYVDGGVDLDGAEPPPAPVFDGGSLCSTGTGTGIPIVPRIPFSVGPLEPPSPSAMALRTDIPLLYVADGAVPLIHVIDVSNSSKPVEQQPLLATNVRNPAQRISVGPLAISPPTRDFKTYLYAVDETNGTLMVYDITDPAAGPHTPMQRPHAELNPFEPVDRLSFSAPVATVAFVQHDWLLPSQVDPNHQYSGILCNPNPHAHPSSSSFVAKGAYYRADQAGVIQNTGWVENFPGRLRGIFGFVTLSTGSLIPIDVDDWDAPCRRPDPMSTNVSGEILSGQTGLLDLAEPAPTSSTDLDEYHVPQAYQPSINGSAAVTLEAFFPVSAPHRIRSNFLLLNDPNEGNHVPYVFSTPQLFDQNGAPVQVGAGQAGASLLLPTQLPPGFVDPGQALNPTDPDPTAITVSNTALANPLQAKPADNVTAATAPGVRPSYDDPTAQIDQDWTATYEGVLPGTPGIEVDVDTTDNYQSLILTTGCAASGCNYSADAGPAPSNGTSPPGFCALGIEDWSLGTARRAAVGESQAAAWTSDYVEIADDLLPQGDAYWSVPYKDKDGNLDNDCWGETSLSDDSQAGIADARFNACSDRFGAQAIDAGASGVGTLADTFLSRDFPIIQAFDDHLVVGRFGWDPSQAEQTSNRVIVGPDPSNVRFMRFARCCFHHEVTFKVRSGGEWLLVGQNGLGLIHHVQVGSGGACVLSCNESDVLKNARELDLTSSMDFTGDAGTSDAGAAAGACPSPTTLPNIQRNDPRALRNPMFSFTIVPPCGARPTKDTNTLLNRDEQWRFSMRGGFNPISISLTQGSVGGVSPQSMRFVEPLGQLAIVDGAQQGLILIDLNALAFAHSPYY